MEQMYMKDGCYFRITPYFFVGYNSICLYTLINNSFSRADPFHYSIIFVNILRCHRFPFTLAISLARLFRSLGRSLPVRMCSLNYSMRLAFQI